MNGLTLDETALDLFARRPTRSFSTGLEFLDAPTARHDSAAVGYRPRQVVELCGPVDAPKTEVLMHVMAAFLTRSASDQQPKERVYLFDHECEVSVSRLRAILSARLIGDKQEHAVDEALKRVQVCRCRDSFQWLATLNHIHFQLLEAASGPLMLAFNCVGSFHAIDKMTAKSVGDGLALSEQVFLFLKQFIRHHSPIIFAAKETSKNARAPWEHAEYLPSSWTSQVSKRILLRLSPPRQKPDTYDQKDDCERIQFEAKCVVGGESRLFICHINGDTIVTVPLNPKTHANNLKRSTDTGSLPTRR